MGPQLSHKYQKLQFRLTPLTSHSGWDLRVGTTPCCATVVKESLHILLTAAVPFIYNTHAFLDISIVDIPHPDRFLGFSLLCMCTPLDRNYATQVIDFVRERDHLPFGSGPSVYQQYGGWRMLLGWIRARLWQHRIPNLRGRPGGHAH